MSRDNLEIRYDNLEKMASHIEKLDPNMFNMEDWRDNIITDDFTTECNTVGCVIGHCVSLDDEDISEFVYTKEHATAENLRFSYASWSERFTGLSPYGDCWKYCFSHTWAKTEPTPKEASKRIREVIEYGGNLPNFLLAKYKYS